MKKIVFILFGSCIFASCYYDKADVINPNAATAVCDTASMTYTNNVEPIFIAHCNTCHAGIAPSAGGGIELDTYATVTDYINKNGNKLLNDIQHGPDCDPMPKGEGQLVTCSINKVAAWINQGMKQ
jgi:cytochrome c5